MVPSNFRDLFGECHTFRKASSEVEREENVKIRENRAVNLGSAMEWRNERSELRFFESVEGKTRVREN